jgi:hypothetical protein
MEDTGIYMTAPEERKAEERKEMCTENSAKSDRQGGGVGS